MHKIFFSAVLVALLLLSSGCIRTSTEILQEDCTALEGISARVSCMKYKAAFLAASGKTTDAISTCEQIKSQYLSSAISNALSIDYYLAGDTYNNCIRRVAEYSEDESVCQSIDDSGWATYTSVIPDLLNVRPWSDTPQYYEKDVCINKVQYKSKIKDKIKENYEIIGFKV